MRRKIFSSSRSSNDIKPATLAPMVDLFTILVVAILRASSPEAPMQLPEQNYEMPLSRQENPVYQGELIDIGLDGIYVNNTRITSSQYWQKNDEVLITDLYEILQTISGSRAQIRAHAKAPWVVVDKALFTAQQAGYKEIEMIALSNVSL